MLIQKKLIFIILTIFFTLTSSAKADNFSDAVYRNFSEQLIQSVDYSNNTGSIVFNQKDEYFTTGDKINKIFAIESVRLFRDVPELVILKITIPTHDKKYNLSVSDELLNSFYNININDLRQNPQNWKSYFLDNNDTKDKRRAFSLKFVNVSTK